MRLVHISIVIIFSLSGAIGFMTTASASAEEDRNVVAKLDRQFQSAVKSNNAEVMANILHEQMVLILSDGRISTREEQLSEARSRTYSYEIQDEDPGTQTVRVFGDSAVVTAHLRIKGSSGKDSFDRHVWFSDTYVCTPRGWRYFVGQVGAVVRYPP